MYKEQYLWEKQYFSKRFYNIAWFPHGIKTENMAISEEIRNCFSDLIKLVATIGLTNLKGNWSLKGKLVCRKHQIGWKSNVTTMNNTADVPVFEFMESKYQKINLLII